MRALRLTSEMHGRKPNPRSSTNNGVPPVPLKSEFTYDTLGLIDCDPSMIQWSM
jgi:hypothetical protein